MKKAKSSTEKPSAEAAVSQASSVASDAGRYAYEGLDRTIHEKARLGILTSLAAHPNGLLFSDLKDLCSLTDGNLSRHLQTLQESELVEVWKRIQLKRPQTLCRLTDLGRQRLLAYINELERVVADAAAAARQLEAKPSVLPASRSAAPFVLPGLAPG
jgi:DNA-binding transcriptional ArsR family regulator